MGFGGSSELNSIFPTIVLDGQNWGESDFDLGFFRINIADENIEILCDVFSCDAPTIVMEEFNGVGEPIFMRLNGVNNESTLYDITVSGILEEL